MAITILPPVVDHVDISHSDSDVDSMSVDSDGGVDLAAGRTSRPSKRPRLVEGTDITSGVVTPGEIVTDDPQWMRLVGPIRGFRCVTVCTSWAHIDRHTEDMVHI